MRVIDSADEARRFSDEARRAGKVVGFVPTMGFLHEGHLSLVRASRRDCGVTVVSIFVNPAQFGPDEDFDDYPRAFERDAKLLEAEGVDAIFAPKREEFYPEGFQTYVTVEKITRTLEGASRPTHFRGVTTVVTMLFNATRPDRAYFGAKDAQQAAVISRMATDLKTGVEIVVAPLVREPDGLAMSSRNAYLSPEERSDALAISRALREAKAAIENGEREVEPVLARMRETIERSERARLDYVAAVERETFESATTFREGGRYFLLVACRVGKTRLIDNEPISIPEA
jgi:pantoate--beta-alanine ligase